MDPIFIRMQLTKDQDWTCAPRYARCPETALDFISRTISSGITLNLCGEARVTLKSCRISNPVDPLRRLIMNSTVAMNSVFIRENRRVATKFGVTNIHQAGTRHMKTWSS